MFQEVPRVIIGPSPKHRKVFLDNKMLFDVLRIHFFTRKLLVSEACRILEIEKVL